MTVVAVIPARWASTRFPGKPLAPIAGKPMLRHVWERVSQCRTVDRVVVATDDDRIAAWCREAGVEVAMTAASHATGTDRVAEVARQVPASIYVNVQGDEPLIDPAAIDAVVVALKNGLERGIGVSTGYLEGAGDDDARNPSVVHLVPTLDGCVLTLSRAPVPFDFAGPARRTIHVGLYAFTPAALAAFADRARGPVEQAESIELLRFLEYGDRIACVALPQRSIGVDHPEDVARVEALLAGKPAPDRLEARLAAVKLLCLDVDGVLTDGGMHYGPDGDEGRVFNVKDGLGILRVAEAGVKVAIVTASDMPAITRRAQVLRVDYLRAGAKDKLTVVKQLCAELGISLAEVAHVGDDLNDLELLSAVGVAATVADAVEPVRRVAHLVTRNPGGRGAVREIAEAIRRAKSL